MSSISDDRLDALASRKEKGSRLADERVFKEPPLRTSARRLAGRPGFGARRCHFHASDGHACDDVKAHMPTNPLMAEIPQYDGAVDTNSRAKAVASDSRTPTLVHRMKHDKSILALAVSSQHIFAGTQGGEILVWR